MQPAPGPCQTGSPQHVMDSNRARIPHNFGGVERRTRLLATLHQVSFTVSGRSNYQVDLVDNPDNLRAGKVPGKTVQRQAIWRSPTFPEESISNEDLVCCSSYVRLSRSAKSVNCLAITSRLQGPGWPEVSSRESSLNDLCQCGAVNTTSTTPQELRQQLLSFRLGTTCPETWRAGDLQIKQGMLERVR